jgi:hypothetical protein
MSPPDPDCFHTQVLCALAIVYTTPWDNYLVYHGAWGYTGVEETIPRVIAVIG